MDGRILIGPTRLRAIGWRTGPGAETEVAGITEEEIRTGAFVEGQGCDFKQSVDLDGPGKSNLVGDVVAFLNAGPGHLVVGVAEKKGRFHAFHPMSGDPDNACLRIQQVILDNIDPKPIHVAVSAIGVEGGFLIDIDVGEHSLRPYQNTITGAFHVRTGSRNTPLTRDMVRAMFLSQDEQEQALAARMRAEDESLGRQGIIAPGTSLTLGVLPREHFMRTKPSFRRSDGPWVKSAPTFHDGHSPMFEGCNGGFHALQHDFAGKAVYRLFVGYDWFFHACISSPFRLNESGRGLHALHALQPSLTRFMGELAEFAATECLVGPFCLMLGIKDLRASSRTEWLFPFTDEVSLPRSRVLERLDDADLVADFCAMVEGSSRHG